MPPLKPEQQAAQAGAFLGLWIDVNAENVPLVARLTGDECAAVVSTRPPRKSTLPSVCAQNRGLSTCVWCAQLLTATQVEIFTTQATALATSRIAAAHTRAAPKLRRSSATFSMNASADSILSVNTTVVLGDRTSSIRSSSV